MTQHWPVPVAVGLISLAALFGLWQRERASEAAVPRGPVSAVATPAKAAVEAPDSAPAPAPTPSVSTPAAPAAPATPAAPVTPVAPAQRPQVWNDLKAKLQTKTGATVTDKPNGGATLTLPGATADLAPLPGWSVTIYNINPKQPDADTDEFKSFIAAATEALGLDASQPLTPGVPQKLSSKLGSVNVLRDPGPNTWVVKSSRQPVIANVTPSAPGQAAPAAPAPAAPAPAAQTPAAPATPAAPPANPPQTQAKPAQAAPPPAAPAAPAAAPAPAPAPANPAPEKPKANEDKDDKDDEAL